MTKYPISDELYERSKNDRENKMIVGSEIRAAIHELRIALAESQAREMGLREHLEALEVTLRMPSPILPYMRSVVAQALAPDKHATK
jgi:hypothetical protein